MAIRRVNSTGRKRISRSDVQIFVRRDSDGVPVFDALLDLTRYKLPEQAMVFVEAYRQTTFMRFPHGTVGEPTPPEPGERRLSEFGSPEGILFRVKITATDGKEGVLLAEADHIPASNDDEQPDLRIPLLPAAPDDLDQEIWKVTFAGDSGPMLFINQKVDDWKDVASSPLFRSLVYPAAMLIVLQHIAQDAQDGAELSTEDPADWRSRWLRFASSLPGVPRPPLKKEEDSVDAWQDWIEDAVSSFARVHSMLTLYKSASAEPNQ